MRALDSAFPGWTIAELKSAGIVAVFRYVAFKPNGKIIEKPEYDNYLAHGIAVGLVWESSGTSFTGGYAAGYDEGVQARKQARELGHPDERPVFAAYDTGAVFSQTIANYQHGFNDGGGCGPQGVYGDVSIGNGLLNEGECRMFWQTNARGWPGDRADSPHAVMIQRYALVVAGVRGSYDVDDVFAADFGQHPKPATVPAKPTPPPKQLPTIDHGDNVKTTPIDNVPLDKDGNGWIDVHGVTTAQIVASPAVFGGTNPAAKDTHGNYRGYDRIPAVRIVSGSNPARLVFSGGEPGGHYNVVVPHS